MNYKSLQNMAYRKAERICWSCNRPTPIYNWCSRMQHENIHQPPAPIPDTITYRYSKRAGEKYWGNICVHCGELQGDHHIHNEERLFEDEKMLIRHDDSYTSRINDGHVYSMYDDIQLLQHRYLLRSIICRKCHSQHILGPNRKKVVKIVSSESPCDECMIFAESIEKERTEFITKQDVPRNIHVSKVMIYDIYENENVFRDMFFTLSSEKDGLFYFCRFGKGLVDNQGVKEQIQLHKRPLTILKNKICSIVMPWSDFLHFRQNKSIGRQYNEWGYQSTYRIENTELGRRFRSPDINAVMNELQYFYDNYALSVFI